ncbi:rab proteins geranylgeranyltransferase component A 1-like isoform X2 [Corticium candelabrum]|uniref:rab proteins geranylgeranyltransferase component A 1-like isoform X2 n=1 Tax=Corticium candelabrum TaxID=121492 RepID=UPI002E2730AE|nr:rab proteins geranylgeranyltransferase component A 1-like isoform X2 [Corticium candelabrum]
MADDLPEEYDAIVLGTGLIESIVAAALSRNGKRVLHLDSNTYYGGNWSTFNLRDLEEWLSHDTEKSTQSNDGEISTECRDDFGLLLKEDETTLDIGSYWCGNITDIEVAAIDRTFDSKQVQSLLKSEEPSQSDLTAAAASVGADNISTETERLPADEKVESGDLVSESVDGCEEGQPQQLGDHEASNESTHSGTAIESDIASVSQPDTQPVTWSAIKDQWRRFNIDLVPKFLFCRGAMVELLIKSTISRYLEFKAVVKFLTYRLDGTLQQVPQSRSDVFSSTSIGMVEKRVLMKFLSFCLEYDANADEFEAYHDKPFVEFLRARHLSHNLQHFVLYAIAMKTEDTPTKEGLKACQRYLQSLGRYGNTPFLWTLYGVGELPQAFCRLCAVFGGLYVLNRKIEKVVVNPSNQFQAVISEGKRLQASWLIGGSSYLNGCFSTSVPSIRIGSRAVFVTDKSLRPENEESVTLVTVPPHAANSLGLVNVIELPPVSFACPKHIYLVHLTCKSSGKTAREDLEATAELLFNFSNTPDESSGSKPNVLWRMYFSQTAVAGGENKVCLPANVVLTSQPDTELGFESAVKEAASIFHRICPNEDFLPAPPDPEDIIYDPDEVHELPSSNPGHEQSEVTTDGQSESNRTEELTEAKSGCETSEETTTSGSTTESQTSNVM